MCVNYFLVLFKEKDITWMVERREDICIDDNDNVSLMKFSIKILKEKFSVS
jgi:ATP-dependent Clp protease adapter protein ClpS